MMKRVLMTLATLVTLGLGTFAHANVLTNGSFELPSLPSKYEYVPGGSTAITGWRTILNGVERGDLITNGVPGTTGMAQDGVLAIDLAPFTFTGGGIEKDFATTPGNIYEVSFYGSTLEGAGRDGTGRIDVSIGSIHRSFNVVNHTLNLTWTQFSFDFQATGATSTLRFENNQDALLHFAFLDNVVVVARVVPVAIDIHPGSFPNSINPNSEGKVPVAILTTGTFNATTVDPTTVRFGAKGTEAAPLSSALEDVDGDGDTDMVLQFGTQSTGIVCGDTSASLTGKTLSGQPIKGSDSINTVGCK